MAFAQRMSRLSSGQVEFRTIPVGSLALRTPNDGMAVEVDPDEVREFIAGLSGTGKPTPKPGDSDNPKVTVNVMNASSSEGMAAGVADLLSGKGFTQGHVGNAPPTATTVVRHAPGNKADAERVVDSLRIEATIEPDPGLPAGHVTVLLGADYPGSGPEPRSHATPSPRSNPGSSSNGGGQSPDGSKPITADTVPCVN